MDKLKGTGHFAKIVRSGKNMRGMRQKYGRKKAILKMFYRIPLKGDLRDYTWGKGGQGSNLYDSSRFQNICAFEGLAPRVYAIDTIDYKGKKHAVQLVEDAGKDLKWEDVDKKQHTRLFERILELNESYGGVRVQNLDPDYSNNVKGKFVDFQSFGIDEQVYIEHLKKVVTEKVWGRFYQSVPELEVEGAFRNTNVRIGDLHLDEIDFKGKTVLDVGCSNGQFANYAYGRGAKRVVGVDLPIMIDPARQLSNYLGNFNIDYLEADLNKESIVGKFDIVLYLSMITHIGFPKWVKKTVKDLFVFEESGAQTDFMKQGVDNILSKNFSHVDFKGASSDFGRKIFFCK